MQHNPEQNLFHSELHNVLYSSFDKHETKNEKDFSAFVSDLVFNWLWVMQGELRYCYFPGKCQHLVLHQDNQVQPRKLQFLL